MTARPLRAPAQGGRIRVIGGRKRLRRPSISPFFVFGVVIVASMIGIVVARTSLDSGAFRLAELEQRIQEEERRMEVLTLEVARLESPTRIGPLAEEMGMVPAEDRTVLVVEGEERSTVPADFDGTQMAMEDSSGASGPGTGDAP